MGGKNTIDLASAFSVPPEIVPFIPELLADLWALGVPPGVVVDLVRPLDLPPQTTRVLDLGCGKGAISITLARKLGFRTEGVDFFPPFIEEARKRAEELGLSGICRFIEGDIREVVKKGGDYDLTTLIWVGGVLGSPRESMGKIRQMVHAGGYMVYADGYLRDDARVDSSDVHTAHGTRMTYGEIVQELISQGDTIVREAIVPEDQTRSLYADYIDSLRKGTEKIALKHPEHVRALEDHVAEQEKMCRALESAVVPAVWLLKKNLP